MQHPHTLARSTTTLLAGVGLAALVAGCAASADPAQVDDPQASTVRVELGDGANDPTVAADAEQLRTMTATWLRNLTAEGGTAAADPITIRYVGHGELANADADAAEGSGPDRGEASDDAPATAPLAGFRAFNPSTRNEFVLRLSPALLRRAGERAERAGANRGSATEPAAAAHDRVADANGAPTPLAPLQAWSNNVDSRSRLSSLTAATTDSTWRKIVHFSNNCSGTLVGPRHIVTAAHCINAQNTNTWFSFTATPGRAGNNWAYGQSAMPHPTNFSWYFTPEPWRNNGGRAYDFGVIVIGDRLGDEAGWMGWWYGTASYLGEQTILNRGYPVCGSARIDDPGDPGSCCSVCSPRHLYGDSNACALGSYSSPDASGWNRLVTHSCDVSGGHSGSPLYFYQSGSPLVTGIHVQSLCGANATDPSCAGVTYAARAVRLTQEYSDAISYFRGWAP